ncbi:MAG: phosphotransferase family protein [Chloroflexi bacterium]|nr:phosphotransferase family protein [Chloroflexota bacterium]
MSLTLAEALARVPQWEGVKEIETTPLGGGITNQNFRVDVRGESFVLRIAGANTDKLGIDRENEYAANLAASKLGVAPEVIYFIRPEGYLVTRFVEGRPMPKEEIRQAQNIRLIAAILQKIHAMPAISGIFNAFRVVENYTSVVKNYGVEFPKNFEWLIERKTDAETALMKAPYPPRPCHNDLLNENFLFDGNIRILDWEYAGMGDIYFDLANLSVNHGFDDEQDRWLLECYFGQVTSRQWARLKIMKIMSDFRESMWGLVQIGLSSLDFDFRGYADKYIERMTQNMKNPLWEQWLEEA